MNTPSTSEPSQVVPAKSDFYLTFFLGLFLGVFGVHRFYTGKIKSGVVQLLTCGGLGIWCFIDMVMILLGKFKDKNGVAMPNINPKLTWAIFVVCVIFGIAGTTGHKESAPVSSSSDVSSPESSTDTTKTVNDVTRIGIYEGTAEPRRVMGVLMTGKWTVAVFKHKNGVLKCKCTLRSYDDQSGWNEPRSETVELAKSSGEEAGKFKLDATGKNLFQNVIFNEISFESGSIKEAFLYDNDTVEVALKQTQGPDSPTPAPAITSTALITKDAFEKIVGKPYETSDQVEASFAAKNGSTLRDWLNKLDKNQFKASPDDQGEYSAGHSISGVNINSRSELAERWNDYYYWWIYRREGITNATFANYRTEQSEIRAFFKGDKVFLLIEKCTVQLPDESWTGWWSNRFEQLNGEHPTMVRTNLGVPPYLKEDKLNLAVPQYISYSEGLDAAENVTILGKNCFGQLALGNRYSVKTPTLILGDVNFLYPLTERDSAAYVRKVRAADEEFKRNRDDIL
jgi:TM2 domain-containing membrane protein YozV